LFSSDAICGGKVRFPSNLTRGESIAGDNCDVKWDGDIGATSSSKSKSKKQKKKRVSIVIMHDKEPESENIKS
jgi:hypothetical protein